MPPKRKLDNDVADGDEEDDGPATKKQRQQSDVSVEEGNDGEVDESIAEAGSATVATASIATVAVADALGVTQDDELVGGKGMEASAKELEVGAIESGGGEGRGTAENGTADSDGASKSGEKDAEGSGDEAYIEIGGEGEVAGDVEASENIGDTSEIKKDPEESTTPAEEAASSTNRPSNPVPPLAMLPQLPQAKMTPATLPQLPQANMMPQLPQANMMHDMLQNMKPPEAIGYTVVQCETCQTDISIARYSWSRIGLVDCPACKTPTAYDHQDFTLKSAKKPNVDAQDYFSLPWDNNMVSVFYKNLQLSAEAQIIRDLPRLTGTTLPQTSYAELRQRDALKDPGNIKNILSSLQHLRS
jgi:hypothetical protein